MDSRFYNNISIINDDVIYKSSYNIPKIKAEYNWYQQNLYYNTPTVFNYVENNDTAGYYIKYIHGNTLSYLYVNETLPNTYFYKIIEFLLDNTFQIHSKTKCNHISNLLLTNKYVEESEYLYINKTLERISSAPEFDINIPCRLNDIELPNLSTIINESKVYVSPMDLSFIHGDMCFSNILLDNVSMDNLKDNLYFIDPRGSNDKILGDYKYDIGKLAHSIIGNYDSIKTNKITGFCTNKNDKNKKYLDFQLFEDLSLYKENIKKFFINYLQKYNIDIITIYKIMINLFISMVPLHKDCPEHQDAMIATALKLYIEENQLVKL